MQIINAHTNMYDNSLEIINSLFDLKISFLIQEK